ncbi:hypothetical protein HY212_02400 [Candidatus Pacearchaeota archaeon]|nr:hypothetical protein [Candidatus Pacearchaeota archaeon]
MDKNELIEKITQKKEFSQLPFRDVELAFEKFDKPKNADYQKIKLTRQFLRKIFSGFSSRKVLHKRDEDIEWFLMKHKSTKERFPFYEEVYSRCFKGFPESFSVIDLGVGINGLSYGFFKKLGKKVDYVGVEAVGQFVELMNYYFKKEKIKGKAIHESLFELNKIEKIIKQTEDKKIIFLFKVIDSLEVMKRDYSKELLEEIVPLSDRVAVSFATHSLGARTKFGAQRGWIVNFIKERFKIIDDFELGGERYIVFEKK